MKRNQATPAQRAEERLQARTSLLAREAQESRADLVNEANTLLAGFGSHLRADLSADGTLQMLDGHRVVFRSKPCARTLADGTVVQGARANLAALVKEHPDTVEARLAEVIRRSLRTSLSQSSHDAPRVAALLLKTFWHLAPDRDVAVAATGLRRISPKARIGAAKIVGSAGLTNRAVGLRYGTQAMGTAPVIATLVEDCAETGQRIAAGESVPAIAKRLGAGRETMKLSGWTTSAITRANIRIVEETLQKLRSAGVDLPTSGVGSRRLVAAVIELWAARLLESEPEISLWVLQRRVERLADGVREEPVSIGSVATWAIVSRGNPGGWKRTMNWTEALAATLLANVVVPESFTGADVPLSQKFAQFSEGGWSVRPAVSTAELWQWGQQLSVCLGTELHHGHYATLAQSGHIVLVGVFRTVGKRVVLTSVAELHGETLALAQHRAKANSNPPAKAVEMLDKAVGAEVMARIARGEM